MATCNTGCATDFVQHPGTECDIQFKLGGISRIIMVKCDTSIDSLICDSTTCPTLTDWESTLFWPGWDTPPVSGQPNMMITGEIVGSQSEPDVASTTVSSCRPEQAHTRTYTMSFMDYNTTPDGIEHRFYRHMCLYYRDYNYFFVTCDEEVFFAPNPSVNVNIIIPETNTELRHYGGTISYRVDCMPRPYAVPGLVSMIEQRQSAYPGF